MQLTWFGTAGFQIDAARHTVLIDPYFTRNPKAAPRQKLQTSDIKKADLIFISHGHFDHVFDVATIASQTGAGVYCGKGVDTTLMQKGVSKNRIQCVLSDGEAFDFGGWSAQAFFSRHVRFDMWLLMRTVARIHFRLPVYLPLVRDYPQGQVLSWRLNIEGKVIHHFGSGGSTPQELERLGRQPTDILLVPMQGHTHISRIAHGYVKALQPGMVIPHHQDNFFPPISMPVDLKPFEALVSRTHPNTVVRILKMNERIVL